MDHFLHPRTNLFHANNLALSDFVLLLGVNVDGHMIEVATKRESTTHCLRVLYNLTRREYIHFNILVEDHVGRLKHLWCSRSMIMVTVELIHTHGNLFEVGGRGAGFF